MYYEDRVKDKFFSPNKIKNGIRNYFIFEMLIGKNKLPAAQKQAALPLYVLDIVKNIELMVWE